MIAVLKLMKLWAPWAAPLGGREDAQMPSRTFLVFARSGRVSADVNLPGLSPFPDAKNTEDGRGTRQCPLAISELVTTINMCQNLSSEYRYEI